MSNPDRVRRQRSHILFVLSNPKADCQRAFLDWYQGPYAKEVSAIPGVLRVQHYEQHEVDITQGRFAPLPFHYLGHYELSLDGAPEAESLIEQITTLHRNKGVAEAPATWLYYPVSEKVGHPAATKPSMMTMAFTNPVEGRESEFREWYVTRHIRDALNVPALVSGQCLERTQFQRPGALQASFSMIAVYEQEGTPEAIIESIAALPPGTLDFPSLHPKNFAEWVYRPLR